jgi:hypothetical protein
MILYALLVNLTGNPSRGEVMHRPPRAADAHLHHCLGSIDCSLTLYLIERAL